MKETAEPYTGATLGGRTKRPPKNSNETIFRPAHTLDEFKELRNDEEVFALFVNRFVKRTYATKWKSKVFEDTTKKVSDIITVSDEAFIVLTLENNWERWLDINNKSKNNYTTSTRGKTTSYQCNIMPKYTFINTKGTRDGLQNVPWKGWSNEGILRFNEICKTVKEDRKHNLAVDKLIVSYTVPEERSKHARKRRKTMTPVATAFVDSESEAATSEEESSDDDDKE